MYILTLQIEGITNDSVAEDIAVSTLCMAGHESGVCVMSYLISHLSIPHTYNITVSAQNRYGTSDKSPPLTVKSNDFAASVHNIIISTLSFCS